MANYFVMGTDHQEYGPASIDELQRWVAEGRADGDTRVRREDSADWLRLAQLPEFAGARLRQAGPPPIRPPSLPPVGRLSVMAVASLVLGLLGVLSCGGTALLGLFLGIIAMVRVGKSGGALTGKGTALAGVIVSGVVLVVLPVVMVPVLANGLSQLQRIICMNNEKELASAAILYAQQHDHHLPPAATWCDALGPGVEAHFRCPVAIALRCGYAFNVRLDGSDLQKVNARTVMFFDADGGWNAHGGVEMAAARHYNRSVVVAFADGHVESVSAGELNGLRWEP